MPKKQPLPVETAAPAKPKAKSKGGVDNPAVADSTATSKLPAFSLLTTGWGIGLEANKSFDGQGARPEPSDIDAVAKAWRVATEPSALALSAIYQACGTDAYSWPGDGHSEYDEDEGEGDDEDDDDDSEDMLEPLRKKLANQQPIKKTPPSLLFFELLVGSMADDEVGYLAKGIDALAADILQIANSAALAEGAKMHGRLLASPASDGTLSYPLLGLGVKAAKVSVNGQRANSLTAHSLVRAGEVQGVKLKNAHRVAPLSTADWVAPANLPAKDVAQAAAELASVRRDLLARMPFDRESDSSTIMDFGALGVLEGPIAMPPDTELPQISKLSLFATPHAEAREIYWQRPRRYSSEASSAPLGLNPSTPKSKRSAQLSTQYSRAIRALEDGPWMDLLSAGLAPEISGLPPGQERTYKLRPDAGPMALARFGPWDKQGADRWGSWIDADRVEKLLKASGNTRQNYFQSYYRNNSYERVVDLLSRCGSHILNLRVAGLSAEASVFEKKLALAAINPKLNFGSLGSGSAGLSGLLRAENPRVGLFQWAMAAQFMRQDALLNEKSSLFDYQGSPRAEFNIASHPPGSPEAAKMAKERDAKRSNAWEQLLLARQKWPVRAKILDDALIGLSSSMALAREAFIGAAISSAQATEDAWLEANSLLAPLRQAQAAGAASPQAVAWSVLNPLAASISSSNPAIRVAALCARPLGFRAAESDAELLSSFGASLRDRGASNEAIAALESSEPTLMLIKDIVANISSPDKPARTFGSEALAFSLHALNVWSEQKLNPDQAALFLGAHLAADGPFSNKPNRFAHGPRQDGIFPSLAPMALSGPEEARAAQALLDGKASEYPAMVAALVHDWASTVAQAEHQGLSTAAGLSLAAERARELDNAFPSSFSIDWAAKPFSSREAWDALGISSPRLSLALKDASSRGGLAGKWCAKIATSLGILDAADGNDVIAKVRDAIKARLGVADGVWRSSIKSAEALAPLMRAVELSGPRLAYLGEASAPKISDDLARSLAKSQRVFESELSYDARIREDNLKASTAISLGLTAAAANSIPLDTAVAVISNVCEPFEALGSPSIPSAKVDSAAGAAFFLAEHEAKIQRLPVIFKEAAKRFEKLVSDSKKPPKDGEAPINPANEIGGEASDLSDWLSGSEHGIWQTLPEKPTWGQLCRLSKAWHDETLASAADREDRRALARDAAHVREAAAAVALREEQARSSAELAANARLAPKLSAAEAVEQAHKDKIAAIENAIKADQANLRKLEHEANKFKPVDRAKWATIIGRHSRDAWEAVELDSAASLTEEGRQMAHCVSSYASQSREGTCRIFSIRLNGERQCTLEIRARESLADLNPNSIFSAVQNKGRHNAAVRNAATLEFCAETVARVQQAWLKVTEEGGFKPAAKKEAKRLAESIKTASAALKEATAAAERDVVDKIVARRLGKAPASEALGGKEASRRSRAK